jgi:NAD(P)-dependent dehydrogenase (short-subunit alcohol dehydrogenase family)
MTPRTIIVTGAGSGIGLACVRRLRESSHVVAALDMRSWPRELLSETAKRTPLGRIGQPDDSADVACFPASDAARFMTVRSSRSTAGSISTEVSV